MGTSRLRLGGVITACALPLLLIAADAARADDRAEIDALKREIKELRRSDAEKQRQLDELKRMIERLQPAGAVVAAPPGESPLDRAVKDVAQPPAPAATVPDKVAPAAAPPSRRTTGTALYARRLGNAEIKLIDVSMDVLLAIGGSSVPDPDIRGLEAGAHDPRRRGFTLQQSELSFSGAVDPYFTAEAHIVATPSGVELEEAFFTTTSLPYGLQLEGGYFFTEFGRINPLHPHAWDWIDQPVIISRLLGGEGLRSPGFRLGWLTPLPWFSELHVGAQNPNEGELTTSFIGEEGVGGWPPVKQNVDNLGDILYLTRWNNSWDVTDSVTSLLGFSGLFGPNVTGGDARTFIYGADMVWKWLPPTNFRGWPFLTWQSEVMKRDYTAANFLAGTAVGSDGGDTHGHTHDGETGGEEEEEFDEDIPGDILRDWGFYTQLLYGFRYRWAAGLRYEYATGSGESLEEGGREADFLRDDRHRLSPLIVWHPSEFSRIRLQYNYDHADFLDGHDAHSIWLGMEVLYGAHPAHQY
jgi:hypothetical protein